MPVLFCQKQNWHVAINEINCLQYTHVSFYMFPSADGAPQARVTALHIFLLSAASRGPPLEGDLSKGWPPYGQTRDPPPSKGRIILTLKWDIPIEAS